MHPISIILAVIGHLVVGTLMYFYGIIGTPTQEQKKDQVEVAKDFDSTEAPEEKSSQEKASRDTQAPQVGVERVSNEQLIKMAQHALSELKQKRPAQLPISTGQFLMWTEINSAHLDDGFAIAMFMRRYNEARESTSHIKNLKVDEMERYEKLSYFLVNSLASVYARDHARIIDFFEKGSGNCDAQTALFTSLVWDEQIVPPAGYGFGVQSFSDHVRPVLYNVQTHYVIDLVSGTLDKEIVSPIYRPEILLHAFLKGAGADTIVSAEALLAAAPTQHANPGASSGVMTNTNRAYPLSGPAFAGSIPELASISFTQFDEEAKKSNRVKLEDDNGLMSALRGKPSDDPNLLSFLSKLTGDEISSKDLNSAERARKAIASAIHIEDKIYLAPIKFMGPESVNECHGQSSCVVESKAYEKFGIAVSMDGVGGFESGFDDYKSKMERFRISWQDFLVGRPLEVVVRDSGELSVLKTLSPQAALTKVQALLKMQMAEIANSPEHRQLIKFLKAPISIAKTSENLGLAGRHVKVLWEVQSSLSLIARMTSPASKWNEAAYISSLQPAFEQYLTLYASYIKKVKVSPLALLKGVDQMDEGKQIEFYRLNIKLLDIKPVYFLWVPLTHHFLDVPIAKNKIGLHYDNYWHPLLPLIPLISDPQLIGIVDLKLSLQPNEVVYDINGTGQLPPPVSPEVVRPKPQEQEQVEGEQARLPYAKYYMRPVTILGAFLSLGPSGYRLPPVPAGFANRLTPSMIKILSDKLLNEDFAASFVQMWTYNLENVIPSTSIELPFSSESELRRNYPAEPLYRMAFQNADLGTFFGTGTKVALPASWRPVLEKAARRSRQADGYPDAGTLRVALNTDASREWRRQNSSIDLKVFDEPLIDFWEGGGFQVESPSMNNGETVYRIINQCTGETWVVKKSYSQSSIAPVDYSFQKFKSAPLKACPSY